MHREISDDVGARAAVKAKVEAHAQSVAVIPEEEEAVAEAAVAEAAVEEAAGGTSRGPLALATLVEMGFEVEMARSALLVAVRTAGALEHVHAA